jgi:hypothetical protein
MLVQWRVASCPTRVAQCPPLHRFTKHLRKFDFGALYTFEQVSASNEREGIFAPYFCAELLSRTIPTNLLFCCPCHGPS